MAIEATFTGWLNETKSFDWGTVLKVSHSVRRKDENGQWQTVGKDYIDVVIDNSKSEEFAHLLQATTPCRVSITGNCKPTHYEKTDGTIVDVLKVWPAAGEVLEQDLAPAGHAYEETPF